MRAIDVVVVSLSVALFPVAGTAADAFEVVDQRERPSRLSRDELARIFTKKQIQWSDGESAVPVDQSSISLVRASFCEEVHGKKLSAITSYWQKQIFTGRGVPPPVRGTDLEVLEFVRTTPGAIGYVAVETSSPGVKEIRLE